MQDEYLKLTMGLCILDEIEDIKTNKRKGQNRLRIFGYFSKTKYKANENYSYFQ